MYNVLVVDDEPLVTSGIKNCLLRSDLNITLVETALNGFEALDCLRMERFDLVLTDIQMSRMSGIELMETICTEYPDLPVVVISAHEQFDYAKKAIRFGAKDYLVKPVEQEDLIRVVHRVLHEKEEIGRRTLEVSRLQKERQQAEILKRNELLMELVTERNLTATDYEELVAELGDPIKGHAFAVLLARLDLTNGGFSNKQISWKGRRLLKYAAGNIMEESLSDWNGLVFNGYGSELIGLIQMNEQEMDQQPDQMKSQLHLIGQMIHMNLKQYLNLDTTVGISTLHSDVFMLPRLMEEAGMAIEWRHLHPGVKVFYYEDVMAREQVYMMEWVAKTEEWTQRLKTCVETSQPIDTRMVIQPLQELVSLEEQFHSCFGILVYRLYGMVLELGHGGGIPLHRFAPDTWFGHMTVEEKLAHLDDYIRAIANLQLQLIRERDRSILSRITAYIRSHFRNPSLKIQDIANEVHFSSAYLSYLFKKEMKRNLWDYVTELRIEEAKRLLETTDMKRYEIAYAVGYESPEHFSRMFKRYTGVSPAEYRKSVRGGSN